MKIRTTKFLFTGLISLLTAMVISSCSAGPATQLQPTPSQTPNSPVSPLSSPTLTPTITRTPRPTSTPIVVEGVGQTAGTISLPNQGNLFPAFGAGAVWIPSPGVLMRIDPITGQVAAEIPLDEAKWDDVYAVAAEGEVIWATETNNEDVVRIDPQTNQIIDRIPLQARPDSIALDGDTLWVADPSENLLLRVDTLTKQISAHIPVDDPSSIAIGGGSVWVVGSHVENLVRIDPNTNSIAATIALGNGSDPAGQVAFGEGGVWVSKYFSGRVARIDPETNQVAATIEIGIPVISVEVGVGAVWAVVGEIDACQQSGLARIDPKTNTSVGRIPVRCAEDIAVSPDGLWVTSYRYKELTLVKPQG
jgi:streptogramin lyase